MRPTDKRIATVMTELLAQRGQDKSICPSEVARALAPHHWRLLMPRVRTVAETLRQSGHLLILQKRQPASSAHVPGPIRLSLPPPPER